LEFHYGDSKATSVGGFDWNLQFTWHAIPERERNRRKSSAEAVFSPTMAGGLFAISKDFFEKLGAYDPGFGNSLLFFYHHSNLLQIVLVFLTQKLLFYFRYLGWRKLGIEF